MNSHPLTAKLRHSGSNPEKQMNRLEIGDEVTRHDRHETYKVTGFLSNRDYQGNDQVWATLINTRTGIPATSIKIENLEKVR